MKRNITFSIAFIRLNKINFAFVSHDKPHLLSFINVLIEESTPSDNVLIDYLDYTTQPIKFPVIHKAVQSVLVNDKSVIRLDNVRTLSDIECHLLIRANYFIPNAPWNQFLYDNHLLMKWISGGLSGIIGHSVIESSRSFGHKENFKKAPIYFNNYEDIWKFPAYFEGVKHRTEGQSVKFTHESMSKLIELDGVSLNKEWSEQFEIKNYDRHFNQIHF